MTSSNITVGQPEPRSSSRVLKPPGGGHSDIFGIYEDNSIKVPSTRKAGPKSTIQEVFCMDSDKTDYRKVTQTNETEIEKQNLENYEKENGEKENGEKGNGEKQTNGKEEAPKLQTPQRVRVPPGGFSSGLW